MTYHEAVGVHNGWAIAMLISDETLTFYCTDFTSGIIFSTRTLEAYTHLTDAGLSVHSIDGFIAKLKALVHAGSIAISASNDLHVKLSHSDGAVPLDCSVHEDFAKCVWVTGNALIHRIDGSVTDEANAKDTAAAVAKEEAAAQGSNAVTEPSLQMERKGVASSTDAAHNDATDREGNSKTGMHAACGGVVVGETDPALGRQQLGRKKRRR